jgi:D-alanyl-D-alanine carboxypeptidase (penicillin-binding protein 5/6)
VTGCSQKVHHAAQTPPAGRVGASGPGKTGTATPRPATKPTGPATAAPAPKPAATTFTVPTYFKVAGTVPRLPWPTVGQAEIALAGVGAIGHSGSNASVPTASVAKAMTAYLVLRDHPLRGAEQGPGIRVSAAEAAAFPHQLALQQSLVPVRAGEVLTERKALEALMLASADNVAQILGRWDAGSVPAFLHKMNAAARQLGMYHTVYTDPSGYDAGTKSTVGDQIRLADAAMRMPSFARVVSAQTSVIPVAGRIHNYNALLGQDGVVGIKTGSMNAAGGCLLFAAHYKVGGRNVTILGSVLGQRSNSMGILSAAFASSRTLLRAFQGILAPQPLLRAGQVVGYVGPTHTPVVATKPVTVVGWPGMTIPATIHATIAPTTAKGAVVGWVMVGGMVGVPVALRR